MRIRHVIQSEDCPTDFESRHPLDLTVEVLPSPDASSAFLVGAMDGHRTILPRGEYTLTLTFDMALPDLPRLRPAPAIGGTSEQVVLTFLQPSGQRWPLPASRIEIPAGLLEWLAHLYKINWDVVDILIDPHVDPERIEEILTTFETGIVKPMPIEEDPVIREDLSAVVERLKIVSERLAGLPETLLASRRSLVTGDSETITEGEKIEGFSDDVSRQKVDDEPEKGGI